MLINADPCHYIGPYYLISGFALDLPVTTKAKKNTFVRKVCSVILSPVIFITFITVCD